MDFYILQNECFRDEKYSAHRFISYLQWGILKMRGSFN